MRIDLEFVELHAPLFIDGMNFGVKLYSDPKKSKAPITIWYDTELRHTIVVYKTKVSMIESTASMTLTSPKEIGIDIDSGPLPGTFVCYTLSNPAVEARQIKAQASGPGMGLKQSAQVSDPTKQAPKTILRKPKFQGQESQGE